MIWVLHILEIALALWVVIGLLPKLYDNDSKSKDNSSFEPNSKASQEPVSTAEIITSLPTADKTITPLNKDLLVLKFKATDEDDVEFDVILYVDMGTNKQSDK